MIEYFTDVLITVVSLHVPILLIPGADVALTTSYGALRGRSAALLAAIGITAGASVMVAIGLSSINAILQLPIMVINIVKLIGALYLLYLMIMTLLPIFSRQLPKTGQKNKEHLIEYPLVVGVLTEVTNPKSMIFFIALFSLVTERHGAPSLWLAGGLVVLFTGIYYVSLALLSSQQFVKNTLTKNEKVVRVIAAGLFLYAAISLVS